MHDYEYIVQLLYSLIETLETYRNTSDYVLYIILAIKSFALILTAFNLYKVYKNK